MIHIEKHQRYAISIFIGVSLFLILDNGLDRSLDKIYAIGISLICILFYRVIAKFHVFGFIERFAKDRHSANHPGPYAFFFWCLFVLVCCLSIFS